MLGIVEKGTNGLFGNEIEFNGKYATYVRFLKEEVGVVQTFRDAYVLGAIIGFMNNKMETPDTTNKVQPASIFPNELSKRKLDLKFIYRIIMLLKEERTYSLDDYMNRAFRDDPEDNPETYASNMLLFNSYVCGGVEYLYNMFQTYSSKDNEKVVDELYRYLHGVSIDVGLIEEDDLPDFTPDFGE